MFYPKINSLGKRQGWYFNEEEKSKSQEPSRQAFRQSFIEGDYACPEFGAINQGLVDEKVDGTNIRIIGNHVDKIPLMFGGRTDRANIPTNLLRHLQETFTVDKMRECFGDKHAVLFGEGYGPKIQAIGGRYRDDVSFVLFDVVINAVGLEKQSIYEIADQLEIEYTTARAIMTTSEVVDYVKSRPLSYLALDKTLVMEGVIARSYPTLLFRHSKTPVMFKLKVRDFHD